MRKAWAVTAMLAVAGCGGDDEAGVESQMMQLAELPTVDFTERQDVLVVLTALNTQGEVRFSAEGLPRFGRLEGSLLRLTPQPGDAGEHTFRLTATDAQGSASREVHVRVARYNTAPSFDYPVLWTADSRGYAHGMLQGQQATLVGPLQLQVGAAVDDESDGVRVCMEVAPFDAPFTGVPTQKTELVEAQATVARFQPDAPELTLAGLQPGARYKLAVWLEDAWGLRSPSLVMAPDFIYASSSPTADGATP